MPTSRVDLCKLNELRQVVDKFLSSKEGSTGVNLQRTTYAALVMAVFLLPASVFTYLLEKNYRSWSELQKVDLVRLRSLPELVDQMAAKTRHLRDQDKESSKNLAPILEKLMALDDLSPSLPDHLRPWLHLSARVIPPMVQRLSEVVQIGSPIFRQEYLVVPERVWMVQTSILLMRDDRAPLLEMAELNPKTSVQLNNSPLRELSTAIVKVAERLEHTARTPRPAMDAEALGHDVESALNLTLELAASLASSVPREAELWVLQISESRQRSFLASLLAVSITLFLSLAVLIWLLKQNKHAAESSAKSIQVEDLRTQLEKLDDELLAEKQSGQNAQGLLDEVRSELTNLAHETSRLASESARSPERNSSSTGFDLTPRLTSAVGLISNLQKTSSQLQERIHQLEFERPTKIPHQQLCTHLEAKFKDLVSQTKIIDETVMQAKLLSFNASIEASRAGNAGKGFAVVAEEIAKLAVQSAETAKEIRKAVADGQAQLTKELAMSKAGREVVPPKSEANPDSDISALARAQSQELELAFRELSLALEWAQNSATKKVDQARSSSLPLTQVSSSLAKLISDLDGEAPKFNRAS